MSETPSDTDAAQIRQAHEELKAEHELLLADYAAAQGAMARREHGAVPTAFQGWAEYRPWDDPL